MSLAAFPCAEPRIADAAHDGARPVAARRGEFDLDLDLRHAGRRRLRVRYEDVGDVRAPVLFVAGGISAHRHLAANAADAAPGWWEAQAGAGGALDPAAWRLLSMDWIGADGALDAPIDPADQAQAVAAVLDRLGIGRLHAFVGASYGALVGLQFAARYGARLQRLVAISGTHRAHPYASACRALQRRVVALGALQCDAVDGLALARQFALIGYRTPEEFAARFGAARVVDGRVRVDAEDYLDHCGNAYAQRTPPVAFLRLSESIDLQDVDPARITVAVTVVANEQDRLVPLSEVYALVQGLRGETRLRLLRSDYGHDAFLKEVDAVRHVLDEALQPEVTA